MYKKCLFFLLIFTSHALYAQDSSFWKKGQLYGLVFGDYYFKAHADSLQRGDYQYSRLPQNSNAFQFRRIYLGYRYNISPKFMANILMESAQENGGMSFIIKYAYLQWNGIFNGADLSIGRNKTPTFSTLTDKIWNYRSVERSVADMHGSPSYDLGISLKGRFDEPGNWGYNLMVGNGEGNSLTDNRFKKFYGEVYGKLAGTKLILDLYADYERYYWQHGFHQSAQMLKVALAYQSPDFTLGLEAYSQHLQDGAAMAKAASLDTISMRNYAVSAFTHGKIWKDKLGFFARMDFFDPFTRLEKGARITSLMAPYDPVNTVRFITAGIDYSPAPSVHFIPNVWYCGYKNQLNSIRNYDLVYRLTFYYRFEG